MQLSVADYNLAEDAAVARLPNRAVEAFQPTHFNLVGYPTRVRTEAEIVKYAEVMHEGETAAHLQVLGGFSQDEWDLVTPITRGVWEQTARLGSPTLPRASLLRSVHVLRLIRRIYGGSFPRIFEFGPGSGYLAVLLARSGYPYAGMDISQGFYLYQNASWDQLSPAGLRELAAEPDFRSDGLARVDGGAPVHLPWWHFASIRPGAAPAFDLVVCNRALCEMNSTALDFSLRLARSFLSGDPATPKAFLFDGWGSDRVSRPIQVVRAFLSAGFAPAFLDETSTTGVFVPWHFGHAFGARALVDALHTVDVSRDDRALSTIRHIFSTNSRNTVAEAFRANGTGNVHHQGRPFGQSHLEGLWQELSGTKDYQSRDEQFWETATSSSFILSELPPARTTFLFGAGSLGLGVARRLRALGRPADGFIDNDPAKWGLMVDGLPVHGPAALPADAVVLITTEYRREVGAQLEAMGRTEGNDFLSWSG